MNVMKRQPNPSGAYSQIDKRDIDVAPDADYQVADGVVLSCGGFGALTVVNNIVTAFTPNETAWNAWQTANPTPITEPTEIEKLRADFDYLVMVQGVTL